MARKTVTIEFLINMTNDICQLSDPDRQQIRQGAMNLLETALHSTGNYRGFRYLLKDECRGNPGINYLDNLPHPDYLLRFVDTDPTRVAYYMPK